MCVCGTKHVWAAVLCGYYLERRSKLCIYEAQRAEGDICGASGPNEGGGGLTLVGVVVVLHVAKVLRVFGNPQPVPVTRVFGPVLVKLAFAVRSWRAGWAGDR